MIYRKRAGFSFAACPAGFLIQSCHVEPKLDQAHNHWLPHNHISMTSKHGFISIQIIIGRPVRRILDFKNTDM